MCAVESRVWGVCGLTTRLQASALFVWQFCFAYGVHCGFFFEATLEDPDYKTG